jgi:sugar phosphate permease
MMLSVACTVLSLLMVDVRSRLLDSALLFVHGFSVYGPVVLLGTMATELTRKEASSTALGITGVFAALGTLCARFFFFCHLIHSLLHS